MFCLSLCPTFGGDSAPPGGTAVSLLALNLDVSCVSLGMLDLSAYCGRDSLWSCFGLFQVQTVFFLH